MYSGDPYRLCDMCGFKYRISQLRKNWKGYMVCSKCWEPQHPQRQRPPGPVDRIKHPDGKPEPADTFGFTNLCTNGGFETLDGVTWTFDGWYEQGTTYGTVTAATSGVYAGDYSCKITGVNGNGYTYVYRGVDGLSESTNYVFHFVSKFNQGIAQYDIYDYSNSNYIKNKTAAEGGKNLWSLTTYPFATPAGCTYIVIALYGPMDIGESAYFDEVILRAA